MDKKTQILMRLSEAQNHRCAFCHVEMVFERDTDETATVTKYDLAKDHYHTNLVCACSLCATVRRNMNAMEFFNFVAKNGRPTKKDRKSSGDKKIEELIITRVTEILAEHGITDHKVVANAGMSRVSEKQIEEISQNIARGIRKQRIRNIPGFPEVRIVKPRLSDPRYRRLIRKTLSEAQNHRCCYCGTEVQYIDETKDNYASFEHVIERKNEGVDELGNLVIACLPCNNLRSELGFTNAEDFYYYLVSSKTVIDIPKKKKTRRSKKKKIAEG